MRFCWFGRGRERWKHQGWERIVDRPPLRSRQRLLGKGAALSRERTGDAGRRVQARPAGSENKAPLHGWCLLSAQDGPPLSAAHGPPRLTWLGPAPGEEAESREARCPPGGRLGAGRVASFPVLGSQACACRGRPAAEGRKERRLQVCRRSWPLRKGSRPSPGDTDHVRRFPLSVRTPRPGPGQPASSSARLRSRYAASPLLLPTERLAGRQGRCVPERGSQLTAPECPGAAPARDLLLLLVQKPERAQAGGRQGPAWRLSGPAAPGCPSPGEQEGPAGEAEDQDFVSQVRWLLAEVGQVPVLGGGDARRQH